MCDGAYFSDLWDHYSCYYYKHFIESEIENHNLIEVKFNSLLNCVIRIVPIVS